jgi:23S rRNA pseudouridine955/2504/2580 synthase
LSDERRALMKSVANIAVSPDEGEQRLDRWLRRRFPQLTQGQIEKLARTGQLRVDGARAKASDRIAPGQVVRVPPLPDAAPAGARGVAPREAAYVQSLVLHRDDDVIVLNKPAGLAVQGGTKTPHHLDALMEGLKFEREEKPKLVHRLDRDTSGVLVLARHPRAAAELSRSFRSRDTEKIYWAIVLGAPRPRDGEIRCWMRKQETGRDADREQVMQCAQEDEGAVHAVTEYATLSDAGQRAAWMALRPVTGRTHQLRFHMSLVGNAIAGDRKYRCDRPTPGGLEGALQLHARAIRMPHPSGGVLKAVAPTPPHMREAFAMLGFDEAEARDPFAPFASHTGRR